MVSSLSKIPSGEKGVSHHNLKYENQDFGFDTRLTGTIHRHLEEVDPATDPGPENPDALSEYNENSASSDSTCDLLKCDFYWAGSKCERPLDF